MPSDRAGELPEFPFPWDPQLEPGFSESTEDALLQLGLSIGDRDLTLRSFRHVFAELKEITLRQDPSPACSTVKIALMLQIARADKHPETLDNETLVLLFKTGLLPALQQQMFQDLQGQLTFPWLISPINRIAALNPKMFLCAEQSGLFMLLQLVLQSSGSFTGQCALFSSAAQALLSLFRALVRDPACRQVQLGMAPSAWRALALLHHNQQSLAGKQSQTHAQLQITRESVLTDFYLDDAGLRAPAAHADGEDPMQKLAWLEKRWLALQELQQELDDMTLWAVKLVRASCSAQGLLIPRAVHQLVEIYIEHPNPRISSGAKMLLDEIRAQDPKKPASPQPEQSMASTPSALLQGLKQKQQQKGAEGGCEEEQPGSVTDLSKRRGPCSGERESPGSCRAGGQSTGARAGPAEGAVLRGQEGSQQLANLRPDPGPDPSFEQGFEQGFGQGLERKGCARSVRPEGCPDPGPAEDPAVDPAEEARRKRNRRKKLKRRARVRAEHVCAAVEAQEGVLGPHPPRERCCRRCLDRFGVHEPGPGCELLALELPRAQRARVPADFDPRAAGARSFLHRSLGMEARSADPVLRADAFGDAFFLACRRALQAPDPPKPQKFMAPTPPGGLDPCIRFVVSSRPAAPPEAFPPGDEEDEEEAEPGAREIDRVQFCQRVCAMG